MGSKGQHCTLSPGLNIWYKLRQVSRGGFSGCMIGSEQRYVVDGSSLTLGGAQDPLDENRKSGRQIIIMRPMLLRVRSHT